MMKRMVFSLVLNVCLPSAKSWSINGEDNCLVSISFSSLHQLCWYISSLVHLCRRLASMWGKKETIMKMLQLNMLDPANWKDTKKWKITYNWKKRMASQLEATSSTVQEDMYDKIYIGFLNNYSACILVSGRINFIFFYWFTYHNCVTCGCSSCCGTLTWNKHRQRVKLIVQKYLLRILSGHLNLQGLQAYDKQLEQA